MFNVMLLGAAFRPSRRPSKGANCAGVHTERADSHTVALSNAAYMRVDGIGMLIAVR